MRLHWLVPGLTALALGVLPPRSARAESDVASTAVLGLEAIDVPTTITDEMSEQLRQRVSTARDLQLVSGKDLVEVKLVFACADEAASCMAQAGKSLDAHKLVYGSVKRSGDDYAVWLKMFDVRRAKIESFLTETLPRRNADAAGIKAASFRWFAKLSGRPGHTGTLQVSSNVAGASVILDGVKVGMTTQHPLTVTDVAAGKHDLVVAKPGHASARHQFTIGGGQTVPVAAALAPSTVPPPVTANSLQAGDPNRGAGGPLGASGQDAGADDGRGGYRTGFWVTLATGLLSAGAAVKYGLDVSDVNKRLDPYRRFPCAGGQVCDAMGVVRAPLTPTERNAVATLNDEGNRDQTLQWICIGVGSALGVASGYLFYKGFLDSDEDRGQVQARRGLRVFPTAGVTSRGIVAEFDF